MADQPKIPPIEPGQYLTARSWWKFQTLLKDGPTAPRAWVRIETRMDADLMGLPLRDQACWYHTLRVLGAHGGVAPRCRKAIAKLAGWSRQGSVEGLIYQGFLQVHATKDDALDWVERTGQERRGQDRRGSTSLSGRSKDTVTCPKPDPRPTLELVPSNGEPSKATRTKRWRARFDSHFWPPYPRKANKAAALRAYMKHQPKKYSDYAPTLKRILALLQARIDGAWAKREKELIPHASTFLNGEEFTDSEIEAATMEGFMDD